MRLQPALERVEVRRGLGPANGCAAFGRLAAGFLLGGVEGGGPFQRFGGERRSPGGMDVEELAPDMGQAGDLADRTGTCQCAESGIAGRYASNR